MSDPRNSASARRRRRRSPAPWWLAIATVAILTTAACRPIGMVAAPSHESKTSPTFPSADGPTSHLTDVRAWPHAGFERIVLELTGDHVPSWQVRYLDRAPVEIGSGDPIAVAGSAFIEIRITPASAFDRSSGVAVATYDGPPRLAVPGSRVVTEIVSTGEFERTLTWVIGLRHAEPFSVVHYESPSRLVVDVLSIQP